MPATGRTAPLGLNDGHALPAVGLGTFNLTGAAGVGAIVAGLRSGYRLLDTAVGYRNETEVGQAVRRSGVPVDEIVVTTKIPGRGLGYDAARRSIAASRTALGLDRIGLHLIHWPMPRLGRYVDTWRAMIAARSDGEITSIGVSNFTAQHLTAIIDATGVVPAVNQIECHPHFPQAELRRIHDELGIRTQSWSPLGRGPALRAAPEVTRPAGRLGVSPTQIVLGWHRHLGLLPLPRSADPHRQRENLDLDRVELTADEIAALSALGRPDGRLWGGDPDTTGFM